MTSRLLYLFGAVLILSAFGWSGQVYAADAPTDYTQFSLDDLMEMHVVSGASKYMQKTSEAPSSISIITAEEIRTYGWRNLSEALSSLRGFYDTYDRNYTYMGVRGIGYPGDLSSRLLVLVDGVRMNDTSIGGALMGKGFPVDLDLISRIEVIRGPVSSLYGTNAMVGVVNIVTREGYQINGTELKAGFSSFGTLESRFTYGHETESGVDMLFSATKGVSEGQDFYYKEFDDPSTNFGWARDCDREEWEQLYGKVIYEGLTVESMYVWRSKMNPTGGIGMMFNDNRAITTDIQAAFAATYKALLPYDIHMAWRAYYQDFTSEIRYPYDFDYQGITVPEGVIYETDSYGERLTSEIDLSKVLPGGHVIAAGCEYQKSFRNDTYVFDDDPYYDWYTLELSPTNYSAYALADVRVMDGMILNLGLRQDHYKSFGGSTNPRYALVTEFIPGMVLKAAYGKAFRAPNGYELTEEEAAGLVGDLIPNEIETYEIIWEQKLPWNLNSTVSIYDWEYRDLAVDVAPEDMGAYYLEHDSINSQGVEFELEGKFPMGVRGRCSWSFNEAEEPESELDRGEPKGPKHMVKANFLVPLNDKGTRIGMELRYSSKRLTVRREWTEEFTLLNLTLMDTSLLGGPEIRASVYNVFDTDNGHPGTWGEDQQVIWQDGRSYRLYLTLTN
jgi:outer membrane receptor for ferrienterochelin and colicins